MKDLFGTAKYTIDACSLNDLMREERRKFARRHFKTLWERIEQMFKGGELISHVEVYEEIIDGGYQEQVAWVKENKHIFRNYDLPAEGDFIARLGKDDELFVHGRKQKANHADPWLVAQAKINNLTLVTEETGKGGAEKLPNVCSKYGIKCIDIFGLIQKKNWSF
jgi:hypothetical protein